MRLRFIRRLVVFLSVR